MTQPHTSSSRGARRWRHGWALAAIPALLFALSLRLGGDRGELWLGQNYDPSYLYLFGALQLAEGEATSFVDHPGVPAQLLGALVLRLRHLAVGGGDLRGDLLAQPEAYLDAVTALLLFLQLAVCAVVGAAVLRRTGSLLAAALAQSSALFSATLLANLPFFKAEALLVSLLLLAGGLAVALAEEESRGALRLLAVTVGLAVATKITAAPFLLLLLLGPRSRRARLVATATALATAAAATFPFSDGLGRFAGYVGRLALRRGMYGRGEAGLEAPDRLLSGFAQLASREPLLVAALGAGFAVWLVARRSAARAPGDLERGARQDDGRRTERLRWLRALLASAALLLAFAAKQPNPRFVVPALAVVGPLGALAAGVSLPRRWRAATLAFFVGAGALLAARDLVRLDRRWRALAEEGHRAEAEAARLRGEGWVVVPYFWASSPPLALWLGNRATGFRCAAALERLHPGFVLFDVWRWSYRPFSGEMNRAQDVPPPGRFVLHGKRLEADGTLGAISVHGARSLLPPFGATLPGDELAPLWAGSAEAIYRPRADDRPGEGAPGRGPD